MTNIIFYRRTKQRVKKTISAVVIFCFTSLQILPTGWADSAQVTSDQSLSFPQALGGNPSSGSPIKAFGDDMLKNFGDDNVEIASPQKAGLAMTGDSVDFLNDSPLSVVDLSLRA